MTRSGERSRRASRLVSCWTQVEDRPLPDHRVLLRLLPGRLRLLEHREHPLARGAGGAKRAAFDQRLDRLLVDGPVVNALAEVEKARERSPLRPRLLDRLDGLEADSLDRVEPEADVAVDDDELMV